MNHGHDHGDDHGHEQTDEHSLADASGQPHRHHEPGQVLTEEAVLDIGGNIGALILYTDEAYRGREIEVSVIGGSAPRVHTAIHERRVQGRVVFAGIYPELVEGEYHIWGDDPALVDHVTIVGGEVSEVDWRIPTG